MWGLGVSYNPARQGGKRPLRNVGMVVNTENIRLKLKNGSRSLVWRSSVGYACFRS